MKPILQQPTAEQLRSMASMLQSPQWNGFGSWLDDCVEAATKHLLTCDEADVLTARAMAAALNAIRDKINTAPDCVRETAPI